MGRKLYTGFWLGNLRERDHLEDPGVDGGYYLYAPSSSGLGSTDWIDLAQDRHRGRTVVNAVKNLRVPYNGGNFLTS